MDGRPDGWMDGRPDGRPAGWTDGRLDGWMEGGRADRWTDRWMEGGRAGGRTDRRMDEGRTGRRMDGQTDIRRDRWIYRCTSRVCLCLIIVTEMVFYLLGNFVLLSGNLLEHEAVPTSLPARHWGGILVVIYIHDNGWVSMSV